MATGVGPSLHVEPTNPCLGGLTPVAKPLIPDTPQPLTHLLGDTPSKDGRARDTDTSTAYKVLHAHQDTAYVMHEGPRHQKNDNLPNTEPQPIVEPIIYVPHTPDSHLCKTLQAADDVFAALHRQLRLRFAERAGTKIVTDCGRSDPWISFSDCRRQKCLPCRSRAHIQAEEELTRAEGRKPPTTKEVALPGCTQESACYILQCMECRVKGLDRIYQGETSWSPYNRGMEHLDAVESGCTDHPMVRHAWEEHGGRKPDFMMSVTS